MNILPLLNRVYHSVCTSERSNFYRALYGANRPAHIESYDDWESLPCVTKEFIREWSLVSRIYLPYEEIEVMKITSGTSGKEPLVFPRIRPPRYHNHFDALHPTSCILNFFPPQHLMQRGRDDAKVSTLTVIDGDAATIDGTVRFALHAGLDHIMCTPSLLDVLMPALERNGATDNIKRIELGGERVTPSIYRRLRETFPNAFLCADYGMTETQGVAGVGEMTEDGAFYTSTKGHYWEIINEDGAVIHDAGIMGELVISHTEYEDVAFPLLRYRTGDYARFVEDTETGDKRYEVLGRVDLDYIKIPGGEIRIEDVERAVKNIHPLLCDDFEVHVFPRCAEHPLSMEVRVASKTEITITEALSQELAQLLASRIHISPTRTYAHGVTDGLYATLRCVVVAPFPKSHWKRRRMFQHE